MLVVVGQLADGDIKKESPNEGTETSVTVNLKFSRMVIKKESPNEGTETIKRIKCICVSVQAIKKESPNEGTETRGTWRGVNPVY